MNADICPVCGFRYFTDEAGLGLVVDHVPCVLKLQAELDAERNKRCSSCRYHERLRDFVPTPYICFKSGEITEGNYGCVWWKERDD